MADNFTNHKESAHQAEAPQKHERLEEKQAQKELQKAAGQFEQGLSGVVEDVEMMSSSEKAPEEIGEGKKGAPAAKMGGSAAQSMKASAIKPLKVPRVDVMRKAVAVEIKRQIRILEREASRVMLNPTQFSPFTLNGIVSKIRELREILASLAFATVETIKGWWMKFVKNISV